MLNYSGSLPRAKAGNVRTFHPFLRGGATRQGFNRPAMPKTLRRKNNSEGINRAVQEVNFLLLFLGNPAERCNIFHISKFRKNFS